MFLFVHFIAIVQREHKNLFITLEVVFQVAERLKCSNDPALQLEAVELAPPHQISGLQLFRQLNAKASRKQVLPIVRCAAESLKKPCER